MGASHGFHPFRGRETGGQFIIRGLIEIGLRALNRNRTPHSFLTPLLDKALALSRNGFPIVVTCDLRCAMRSSQGSTRVI